MLHWLVPLFFFGVLMGSPVPGFLAFMLIGLWHAWQSWRQPHSDVAFRWTREDTWLALCFMSIPIFKLTTLLWSEDTRLALQNVGWHLYFIFWPLILLGLHRCKDDRHITEKSLAIGLICFGLYALAIEVQGQPLHSPGVRANVGILAQLVMAAGIWNFAILTRPGIAAKWRAVHLAAALSAFVVLVFTTRRLELLGLTALIALISIYRLRNNLNFFRTALLLLGLMGTVALLIFFRLEKFQQGLTELHLFFFERDKYPEIIYTSWGARLEMWRTAWEAFAHNPWLGIGASARPYAMAIWGGPSDPVGFGHRHFHSHLVQTMVEGGIAGLCVMLASLYTSSRLLIAKAWARHRELALLALCLLGAYVIEGLASATLQYDKANAYLVVSSAWLWGHIKSGNTAATHPGR